MTGFGINCINCNKMVGYELRNQNLSSSLFFLFFFSIYVSLSLYNKRNRSSLIFRSSVLLGFIIGLGIMQKTISFVCIFPWILIYNFTTRQVWYYVFRQWIWQVSCKVFWLCEYWIFNNAYIWVNNWFAEFSL